jgi:hypothetical protein
MSNQHSNFAATIQTQIKSWTIQKVSLQILRLLAEDAHLETKRSYEGPPLFSGLRRGQHRGTLASEWDASKDLNAFKKCSKI